jgi:hypothetical protein
MRTAVVDKTEPAATYLAARLWFVGSTIRLVAHHGGFRQTPAYKDYRELQRGQWLAREVAWDLLGQRYLLALAARLGGQCLAGRVLPAKTAPSQNDLKKRWPDRTSA